MRKQNARVLVIGDAMLDAWCFGRVERFSREAPIPIFLEGQARFSPGGAAGAAAFLAKLGVDTSLFAVTGDDDEGARLRSLLKELGIHTEDMPVWPEKPTAVKRRYYNDCCREMQRVDREDLTPTTPDRERELLLALRELVGRFDLLIVAEYRKSFLTRALVRELLDLAELHGVPVFVDPQGNDPERYRGATVIKPNRQELGQLTGLPICSAETAAEAAVKLCRLAGCRWVLATLDKDGLLLADESGVKHAEPKGALPGELVACRTVGAGDEVLARYTAALLQGQTPEDAAADANRIKGMTICGREICARPHVRDAAKSPSAKILGKEDLRVLEPKGRSGKRLVFTNGCFDILHAGHVFSLQEARRLGDLLAVGVNSDESVRRLKGEDRPVCALQDRMAVLAGLECVDFVIPFEEDTPLRLIERLLPDVLVKGGDYTLDRMVGADVVLRNGGSVEIVPFLEGRSTTETLRRLTGQETRKEDR